MNAMTEITSEGTSIIETWSQVRARHLEEKAEILRGLASAGLTLGQAAQVLEHSSGHLRTFISYHELGIKFNRKDIGEFTSRAKSMADKFHERSSLSKSTPWLTCKEAAQKLGISADCLRAYSTSHDIAWKPAGEW